MSKSTCTKHTLSRTLLEVEMSEKSACRFGAKHASKSRCAKHTRFVALLEADMSKRACHCDAKHMSKSKV